MDIKNVAPSILIAADYNPRKATEKEHKELKASIEEFGLVDPIIVNGSEKRMNIIIGGHFRHRVATEMGLETVPVVYVDLPDLNKERELNLRLNKNSGHFDYELLAAFDEEMLIDVGFESKEIDLIFGQEIMEKDPDFTPPPPEKPKAKLGDIYQLGKHRLMCGDSTSQGDMEKLLSGVKAKMVFTDPPYNVNYSGEGKNTSEGIKNDNMSEESFINFSDKVFETLNAAMDEGAVYYICSGWSSYPIFHTSLVRQQFYRAGTIIWVKNNTGYGWNDYRYKHEWILVGKKKRKDSKAVSIMYGWKKGSHYFRDSRDECDVWEIPRKPSQQYIHPTEKPVYLIEKAIINSSQRDWPVLDPFGGSGSTMIAAERLGRNAYLMEYDPKYVDVIIDRWQQFTEKKAVKLGV